MIFVHNQCAFSQSVIVPSDGLGGALALFWKIDIRMVVQKVSLAPIDVIVDGADKFGPWHLTSFYGNPSIALRVESWNLLKSLSGVSQLPWLVVGDFNDVRF